ncbi:MAG: hypothetical protein ACTSYB_02600 [Candidatus Helarchaeota archaeon]
MPKIDKEAFVKRVYEIVNEMKIPLIDDRVYNKCVIAKGRCSVEILFKYDGDESVIKGFLGLADYYHTVVVRKQYSFVIPHSAILFELTV